ncbi:phosphonate C-P lyase system protein PhnG [Thermocrinis sp.]
MSCFREVVLKMDKRAFEKLKAMLPEVSVKKEPRAGLLMVKVKDCFDMDFCLGEALVYEAEVEYKGQRGYAMALLEDDPERVLALAVLDAFFMSEEEKLKQKILKFLRKQEEKLLKREELERKLLAKTKVEFEIMPKR